MYKPIVLAVVCSGLGLFAADAPSAGDSTFVTKASQGGAAEVKLGQLAADKGKNQKVKDFGKRMADDHAKAGDELGSIALKKNLKVSSDLTSKDEALYKRLSGLSGRRLRQGLHGRHGERSRDGYC